MILEEAENLGGVLTGRRFSRGAGEFPLWTSDRDQEEKAFEHRSPRPNCCVVSFSIAARKKNSDFFSL